tara:strand:- start:380 stop:1198 length:819 start_codon:yes stop_codon:yes gene_type:complete
MKVTRLIVGGFGLAALYLIGTDVIQANNDVESDKNATEDSELTDEDILATVELEDFAYRSAVHNTFYPTLDDVEEKLGVHFDKKPSYKFVLHPDYDASAQYDPKTETIEFFQFSNETMENRDRDIHLRRSNGPFLLNDLDSAIRHESGHHYIKRRAKALNGNKWLREVKDLPLLYRIIDEGISLYFETATSSGNSTIAPLTEEQSHDLSNVDSLKHSQYTYYSLGEALMNPILQRFGAKAVVDYVVLFPPIGEELDNALLYREKMVSELSVK